MVTLTGSAFTNLSQGTELTSNLSLSDDGGSLIELIPDLISENSMTVIIPGTLAIGSYTLRAVKLDKFSNPVVISIKPEVKIADVSCNEGILTINGSGFGDAPPEGAESYINIEIDDVPVGIISWTDTEVGVSVSNCSGTVTVNSLFGSAIAEGSDCEVCAADCNNDGTVDVGDLLLIKQEFLQTPVLADCNGDGNVDLFDLLILIDEYSRDNCCTP